MDISGSGQNNLLNRFIISVQTISEVGSLIGGIWCTNFQRNKKHFLYVSFEGTEIRKLESDEETVACCCCSHSCRSWSPKLTRVFV